MPRYRFSESLDLTSSSLVVRNTDESALITPLLLRGTLTVPLTHLVIYFSSFINCVSSVQVVGKV